jgi:hypothetical protein
MTSSSKREWVEEGLAILRNKRQNLRLEMLFVKRRAGEHTWF